METKDYLLLYGLIYKLFTLLVGTFSIYLGYKLFIKSIWGRSGELEAQFSSNKIVLKKGAPGTFFVLLGTIIICTAILRGFSAANEIKEIGLNDSTDSEKERTEVNTENVEKNLETNEKPEFPKID